MRRPRRVSWLRYYGWLLCALALHAFGALTWVAFLGFSSDYAGTDRQFSEALGFGAVTWLVAALLMVWFWRTEKWPLSWCIPFVWWYPSFLLMIAVVYGWD